jgi:hypothetical protein
MNNPLVDKVAEAILYEGYILYPYRASSPKNRERFTFGRVYPQEYSEAQGGTEPCVMQTQCLARRVSPGAAIGGRVKFLHPMAREVCAGHDPEDLAVVPEMEVDGRLFQTWHEAVEREVGIPETPLAPGEPVTIDFSFPASESTEPLLHEDGREAGAIRRRQLPLTGMVKVMVEPVDDEVVKITVSIANHTRLPNANEVEAGTLLLATFASTHTIVAAEGAEFLSQTDPPERYTLEAMGCENIGTWPVLVGDEEKQQRDTLLSSPIILYDYPKIAAESPGDLCDGTEIDEILTLRVMTMTDDEKHEMRNVDSFARRILERTEALGGDDLLKMHGAMRDIQFPGFPGAEYFDQKTPLHHVTLNGVDLEKGDRVRIRPRNRADAMDLMLTGKIGLIEAIEQDAEGQVHLALVVEDDPGRDLGMMRQPGHRSFTRWRKSSQYRRRTRCTS